MQLVFDTPATVSRRLVRYQAIRDEVIAQGGNASSIDSEIRRVKRLLATLTRCYA